MFYNAVSKLLKCPGCTGGCCLLGTADLLFWKVSTFLKAVPMQTKVWV